MSDPKELFANFIENMKQSGNGNVFPFLYNASKTEFNPGSDPVFYSGPFWDNEEIVAILDSIFYGSWLVAGEKVRQFEREFSKKFNFDSSLMVNSGSSANLILISALKKHFQWQDDAEVIVSCVGFPTTIAPLVQCRLKPAFVDVTLDDLNFDLDQVEAKINSNTVGIFISPVLANPSDMDRLCHLAEQHDIKLILDNCDSLGSKWNGKFLNEYCVAASCSFYPAHHMCTGEGGMVSSNDQELIKTARSFAWWGRDCYCVGAANLLPNGTCKNRFDCWLEGYDGVIDHKYVFSNMGYNLKPLDLQGAVGSIQLKKFDEIHKRRRDNKEYIQESLQKYVPEVHVCNELPSAETSWFGVPIICPSKEFKQAFVRFLESRKIQTRNYFAGNILMHPGYKHLDSAEKYPNACSVLDTVFFVGCTPTYSTAMLDYINQVFEEFSKTEKVNV